MSRLSPTAEGFRATFRRPALTVAEITWRWAVGATASALLFFGLIEYLRTLPVSNAELLFLRTRQPILVGQAIAHILRGSLDRVVVAGILGAMALTCLWMVAASLGRIATVRALLEYFVTRRAVAGYVSASATANDGEREVVSDVPAKATVGRPHTFSSLLGINFLRAALVLAAVFGLEGASILAGFASPSDHPQPGLAFLVFWPLAGLVCLAWYCLNWFLSLAAVFAVRDAEQTFDALSAAAKLCRERTGPLLAVSTWTGLAHFAAFVGATIVVSLPIGLIAALPIRLVIASMILVTLAYFVIADWLYTARLAGYVCIAEMPEALLVPPPLPPLRPSPPSGLQVAPAPPLQTAIDRDEPILSDVPGLPAQE